MDKTKVKELMTEHPILIDPNTTLESAAEIMRDIDCGILPIGTEERPEGIITDRDIVTRAIARSKNPATEIVSDYMTPHVHTCNEDNTLEEAADEMRMHKVSRLIVENREGKITGLLSFGCILRKDQNADEVDRVVRHATHARVA